MSKFALITSIRHYTRNFIQDNESKKKKKPQLQIRKEEVKLSFFKKEKPSNTHTHTHTTITANKQVSSSKAAGYETNIQKTIVSLYIAMNNAKQR